MAEDTKNSNVPEQDPMTKKFFAQRWEEHVELLDLRRQHAWLKTVISIYNEHIRSLEKMLWNSDLKEKVDFNELNRTLEKRKEQFLKDNPTEEQARQAEYIKNQPKREAYQAKIKAALAAKKQEEEAKRDKP
jgi:hypothetical protein